MVKVCMWWLKVCWGRVGVRVVCCRWKGSRICICCGMVVRRCLLGRCPRKMVGVWNRMVRSRKFRPGFIEVGDWQPGLGQRTAEVSAGGGSVVFMSNQELPVVGFPHGYPSEGLEEVYLFSAAADQLVCVSCSSSGEVPASSQFGAAGFLAISWSDTYIPMSVSEDGDRVFFDSGAPLVQADTNNRQDVYEWEREGTGGCAVGAGANGGCVYLLSGGTSEAASWFVGASANGDDVFIVTRAQLVPGDGNDAFDLYDVRVGGVQSVPAPLCSGTGCQGVPAAAPGFATPASTTFNGVGNFAPSTKKPGVEPKKCKKGFTRKHNKCVKAKAKKKKKKKKAKRVSSKRVSRDRGGK